MCHKLLVIGFYRVGRKSLGIKSRKFRRGSEVFSWQSHNKEIDKSCKIHFVHFFPEGKGLGRKESLFALTLHFPGWKLFHPILSVTCRHHNLLSARCTWPVQYKIIKSHIKRVPETVWMSFVCRGVPRSSGVIQGLSSALTPRAALCSSVAGLGEKHGQPSLELIFINEE